MDEKQLQTLANELPLFFMPFSLQIQSRYRFSTTVVRDDWRNTVQHHRHLR